MISFKLKPQDDYAIGRLARRKRRSKSALARRIIEAFIEAEEDARLLKIAQNRMRTADSGKFHSMEEARRALGL